MVARTKQGLTNETLVIATVLSLGMVGAAAAQDGRCLPNRFDIGTPGETNQSVKERFGTPGQNDLKGDVPANEFAQIRNEARKETCPPPGQTPD